MGQLSENARSLLATRAAAPAAGANWEAEWKRLTTRLVPVFAAGNRIVAITSGQPGEGVTTVAYQLSRRLVEQGRKRVVVVDANLRNPSLHRFLGGTRSPGLTEFLKGDLHFTQVTQRLPRLHFISAGRGEGDPVHLLESPRFAESLELLAKDYEVVLVDTPALVAYPETEAILRHVDGCVLVAEADRSRAPAVRAVADRIRDAGVSLIGAVLNKRSYPIPERLYRHL
jgi:capsular exopolysaccharide synthesis family protein